MQTITCTNHLAAGVFAPGHLGELTQIVPFEMVDEVLAEATGGSPYANSAQREALI